MKLQYCFAISFQNETKMSNQTIEESVRQRQEAALQELNSQLLRSEIQDVADKANVVWNTANSYLKGCAPKAETATDIIKAARSVILKREQPLVAA